MLITFRSTATESITMFGDIAKQLLRLMGASGKIPGALSPEDVPNALHMLETGLQELSRTQGERAPVPPAANEDWAAKDPDEEKEQPVELGIRAVPLIALLKRAAGAHAEVMWESN